MKTFTSILYFCIFYSTSAIAADDSGKLIALQQRILRLESGVRGAEAIRAIKRLQYAYGGYAEQGLWYDLADLFANNGVGRYPSGDLDKEAIRKLFVQDVGKGMVGLGEGVFYPHIMLQPQDRHILRCIRKSGLCLRLLS